MFSCLKRFLQLAQRYTYDYRKLLYDDKAHFLGTVRTPPERVIGEAAGAFLWLVEWLPQIVGAMLIWQNLSEDLSSDHAADERECKMSRAASSSPGRKLHLCINVTELGKQPGTGPLAGVASWRRRESLGYKNETNGTQERSRMKRNVV